MASSNETKVFENFRDDATCVECKKEISDGDYIVLSGNKSDVKCLTCVGLSHLVFLPSGNVAITRRSKKNSTKFATVYRYNQRHKRNERQGLLVEEEALNLAKQESESDKDVRAVQREKNAIRRDKQDKEYQKLFAEKMRELYPSMPEGLEKEITKNACEKYSGHVGRSAAAKELNTSMISLAVEAHVRHTKTDYDMIISSCGDKEFSRSQVNDEISRVLCDWKEEK